MGNLDNDEDNSYLCPLSPESRGIALRSLSEEGHTRSLALAQMKEWLASHPCIKYCRTDASFLLRFLRLQKFRIAEAETQMEKYLRMRQQRPDWFQNLDILDNRLQALIDRGYFFALPERDEFGRRVFFSRPGCLDSSKDTASDMMRGVQIGLESLIEDEENQVRGFTYVFDEKGVGFSIVTLWTPGEVSKALHCSEKTMPVRHKEIHLVNLPITLYAVFEFAKTLLSDKIKKRFQVHNNVDRLINAVPARILPREYGGDIPVNDMIQSYKKELLAVRHKVLRLDDIQYEKSRKHKQLVRTISSLPRSFSRIEMD